MQLENYDEVMLEFEEALTKKIDRQKNEYFMIRAGRANPRMLDKITADYYGTQTLISQMANISVPEARVLLINVWDQSQIVNVSKAISAADLGVNPIDDGKSIRLIFPALTEERRREIVKTVKKLCEDCKISLRNARRDCLDTFKTMKKDGDLTEDELATCEKEVQKLIDAFGDKADQLSSEKEKEVMEI